MLYFNDAHSYLKQVVLKPDIHKPVGNTIKALYEYNYHFSQEKRTVKILAYQKKI